MDNKFKSIVDELFDYTPSKNKDLIIESRGQQLIASAINLIHLIKESYDEDLANDLSKRLVRAIASEDQEKFTRKLRQLRESKGRTHES